MAVLDLSTGKEIEEAQPSEATKPAVSDDPIIKLRGLIDRQKAGEQGLDNEIAEARKPFNSLMGSGAQVSNEGGLVGDIADAVDPYVQLSTNPQARSEAVLNVATGAVAQPVSGLSGLASAPFVGAEKAAEIVKDVQSAMTYDPKTEEGQKALQAVGTMVEPIAKVLKVTEDAFGDFGFEHGGAVSGAIAKAIPAAIIEAVGFKGVSGAATKAAKQASKARKVKNLGLEPEDLTSIERSISGADRATEGLRRKTNMRVDLLPAQKTQLPSELIDQRLLGQLDATSRRAAKALEKQNKQVYNATNELIINTGSRTATESGAANFKTAANLAIDARRQAREAATRGLYDDALSRPTRVDLTATRRAIENIIEDAPADSDFLRVGNRLRNLTRAHANGNPPSLRQLQKAKITMQDMIDDTSGKATSPTIKAEIIGVKRNLVDEMKRASPEFARAEDEFIRLSPAISDLENSLVGQISNIKDTNIKNLSGRIFDPALASTDPAAIRNAKTIIDEVAPNAWNDLLKVELNRRVSGMVESIGDADLLTKNIPAQLKRAIYGNPKQRQALFAGMSKEQAKNFAYLEDVLKRAESGRAAGSPTELFRQSTENLKGVAGRLRERIFEPLKSIQKTGEQAIFERNAKKLADFMFDPKSEPLLSKLRKISPNSKEAAKITDKLFDKAKITAASTVPAIEAENNKDE